MSLKQETKLHSLHPNFHLGADVESKTRDPEHPSSGHFVIA